MPCDTLCMYHCTAGYFTERRLLNRLNQLLAYMRRALKLPVIDYPPRSIVVPQQPQASNMCGFCASHNLDWLMFLAANKPSSLRFGKCFYKTCHVQFTASGSENNTAIMLQSSLCFMSVACDLSSHPALTMVPDMDQPDAKRTVSFLKRTGRQIAC